jgi:phytoene dehydrogenase-like protein
MIDKTILIIGAGLAGLATGCYAQMNGYQTRILEQHTRPGGVCTAWKRSGRSSSDGYTIDGCIHWLMGAAPGSAFRGLYDEVGALEGNTLLPLDRLVCLHDEATGQRLEVTADLDRLEADLRALSSGDGPLIDEWMRAVRAFRGLDLPVTPPQELMGPLDWLRTAWQMRSWLGALRRYNLPLSAFARRFQNPFLGWGLSHVFLPEMPLSFLAILLAQLADGQLAAVERGSLAFALAIARRYHELGGEIAYGTPAKEILVEPGQGRGRGARANGRIARADSCGRAVGVRLADGSEQRADVVVSAADGHSTLFEMLGGRFGGAEARARYETWATFPPIGIAAYGLTQTYPDWPAETLIRLQRPLFIGEQEVEALSCSVLRGAAFAPPGGAVIKVYFQTDFERWDDLQRADRTRYEAEKARVASQVLERLERHLPGVKDAVEMTDVATPYTFWRYTRNWRGAYEGWLMTPEQSSRPLPKTLPGLQGFYMAGQWVEPGGGVPAVLCSGRQVVQLICHHDKVSFTPTPERS